MAETTARRHRRRANRARAATIRTWPTRQPQAPTPQPRLALQGIRKVYPAVVANDGIDLAVAPGEIHAVLGENGAGKSTLMKIIYGVTRPTEGTMRWEGAQVSVAQPGRTRARWASAWCSSTSRCSRR